MKSTNFSENLRSRVVSLAIVAVLTVCAMLSFLIIIPNGSAVAETQRPPAASSANGIRFVQVAAGENFAIGLTYDRKLYGWSLNSEVSPNKGKGTAGSLGEYYDVVPSEIPVVFRKGPQDSVRWDNKDKNSGYHVELKDDKIKTIAATRTTAAFLTEAGYIYTWGKESSSADLDSLLLRRTASTDVSDGVECYWYTPYIIDYHFFGYQSGVGDWAGRTNPDRPPLEIMIPDKTVSVDKRETSFAAGEYNYIFLFDRTFTGDTFNKSYYYTCVWGSRIYTAYQDTPAGVHTYDGESNISNSGGDGGLRIFDTNVEKSSDNSGISVVAGGFTVGINNPKHGVAGGTSLQIRGRNFLTSQNMTVSGTDLTPVNTIEVLTPSGAYTRNSNIEGGASVGDIEYNKAKDSTANAEYIVKSAIAGNGDAGHLVGKVVFAHNERYYARQAIGAVPASSNYYAIASGNLPAGVYGADGKSISDSLAPTAYAVSLGNDIGYGIAGGKLYAWGDNKYGQLAVPTTTPNSKTPIEILTGKSFKSVAAGKQLSAATKAFSTTNPKTFEITGEAEKVGKFVDDVLNMSDYISAALQTNGTISVWSNNRACEDISFMGMDAGREPFAAIYSGYGNNLFAVTVSGKLVRITVSGDKTKFEQFVYDSFKSGVNEAEPIANYALGTTNKVRFGFVPEQFGTDGNKKFNPALGSATFYVWSATTSGQGVTVINDAESSGADVATAAAAYRPLVVDNKIGDAYRIIGNRNADNVIPYLKASELPDCAPVFMINDTVIGTKQLENMLTYEFVDDGAGVGIKVTPKQSSQGNKITLKFYVARYNNYGKYAAATDDAIYYDYKQCSIEITIEDTPSVQIFQPYTGSGDGRQSNVPLLDPNNEYNNSYSLAVQDVSDGIKKLVAFLNRGNFGITEKDITDKIEIADKGFPAASRVAAGNLSYYLNAFDLSKFNGSYKYLFADRDSDIIKIDKPGSEHDGDIIETGYEHIKGEVKTITVTVAIANNNTTGDFKDDAVADSGVPSKIEKWISNDFNNLYGLYNITYSVSDVDSTVKRWLSFSYDVLTFTADGIGTGSTGDITYTGAAVNSYVLKPVGDNNAMSYIAAKTVNQFGYDVNGEFMAKMDAGVNVNSKINIAAVYSQPSLRISRNGGVALSKVYTGGKGHANNKYVESRDDLAVGKTVNINLADYFNKIGNSISFSFNDKSAQTELDNFGKQFVDYTGGTNNQIVKLEGDTITVHATTAAPITFTVDVRRFRDSDKELFFGDDEKIEMTFIFGTKEKPISEFSLNVSNKAKTTYLITKPTTISLFGTGDATTLGNPDAPFVTLVCDGTVRSVLESGARMFDIRTSEDSKTAADKIFSYTSAADGKSFEISPNFSGSGIVQFSVNVYGKSVSFSLVINVSKKTTMPNTVNIIDDGYVDVSDLELALKNSNSFNENVNADKYKILYNDIANAEEKNTADKLYNAIYFTNKNNEVEKPLFIKNAIFENLNNANGTKPYIRLIASKSSVKTSDLYYMHVKFTKENVNTYADDLSGEIIEIIVPVECGKIKLEKDHSNFVLELDCRNTATIDKDVTVKNTGINAEIRVPIKYLLDMTSIESPEHWEIALLSADVAASKYFKYSRETSTTILISPVDNTKDNHFELNVSVYNKNDSSAEGKVISFEVAIKGIITDLDPMTGENGIIGYGNILIYSASIVFGVLFILFVVRFVLYVRKRAKQRAIIKRNAELIRMRDRLHGKAGAATREQLVRSKMKMDDPAYARKFNNMRKAKEEESGISLENSELAATAERKTNKKKKKGGKKTVAELKAELAAKKAAFAAAQAQGDQPVNPFAQEVPLDGSGFATPVGDFGGGFASPDVGGGFASPDVGGEIVFDASDVGDGNM